MRTQKQISHCEMILCTFRKQGHKNYWHFLETCSVGKSVSIFLFQNMKKLTQNLIGQE